MPATAAENNSVSEVFSHRFRPDAHPGTTGQAPLRSMTWWDAAFLAAAGVAGGLTGSIAGLASIATYPALLLVGLPPVTANVTNTVALVFNGVGSVLGSRPELAGQGPWLKRILPVTAAGGVAGAALLLSTPAEGFEKIVPILLGIASIAIVIPRRATPSGGTSRRSSWPHRQHASRVHRDLPDLHLRRLFRCRGRCAVARTPVACRPRDAGPRQRLQERHPWRRQHRCRPDLFVSCTRCTGPLSSRSVSAA